MRRDIPGAQEYWDSIQKYKEESRVFQRVRRSLPKRADCNPLQLTLLEAATLRYSQASKARQEAEHEFRKASNPQEYQLQKMIDDIKEAISGVPSEFAVTRKEVEHEMKQREKFEKDPALQAFILKKKKEMGLENWNSQEGHSDGLGVPEDRIEIAEPEEEELKPYDLASEMRKIFGAAKKRRA